MRQCHRKNISFDFKCQPRPDVYRRAIRRGIRHIFNIIMFGHIHRKYRSIITNTGTHTRARAHIIAVPVHLE